MSVARHWWAQSRLPHTFTRCGLLRRCLLGWCDAVAAVERRLAAALAVDASWHLATALLQSLCRLSAHLMLRVAQCSARGQQAQLQRLASLASAVERAKLLQAAPW